MTDGDKRRYTIFRRYADHLNLLRDKGILKIDLKYERTYICPICKEQFSEAALDQSIKNPLTLEDAPPKSLGGKAEVLTCRDCNNTCGQQIDVHLTERLIEIDQKKFKPGVTFAATTERDGKTVQALVKVSAEGEITVQHANTKNNPKVLKEYIESTKKEDAINIILKDSKVDLHRLQIALLKTGFLLVFAKFGYDFILDPTYDEIRTQLKNPTEKNIYPLDFWFNTDQFKPYIGVPFVIEQGIEAIFPIFSLNTEFSEHIFATIIPLTNKPIAEVIQVIKDKFKKNHGFEAAMDGMDKADYLFDDTAIIKMLDWIKKIK